MKVIIPGGSGFIGRSLASFLVAKGYQCKVFTRHPTNENDIWWDGASPGEWCRELEGASAIVNMTGRSVNCIYNAANRKEILDSRINSVRAIQAAVVKCAHPPEVIVQAGSLAIYGDTTRMCDEQAPHAGDFSARVCEAWEKELFRTESSHIRKCVLRIGFVLGPNGGALLPLRKITKLFLGGTAGGGGQYISWLHGDDLNRMVLACIEDRSMSGIFNAAAPHPVTNREFMKTLRKTLGRPWCPPAPAWIVKLVARHVFKSEASLALTGRKCFPARLLEHGFVFNHTDLEATLGDIMSEWDK